MSIGRFAQSVRSRERSPLRRHLIVVALISFACAGCRHADDEQIVNDAAAIKTPRAVSTFKLKASTPSRKSSLSGSAEAWKSEEIGFEVPGRISWIIEPNEDIQGRLPAATASNQPPSGTVIAKLDDEHLPSPCFAAIEKRERLFRLNSQAKASPAPSEFFPSTLILSTKTPIRSLPKCARSIVTTKAPTFGVSPIGDLVKCHRE